MKVQAIYSGVLRPGVVSECLPTKKLSPIMVGRRRKILDFYPLNQANSAKFYTIFEKIMIIVDVFVGKLFIKSPTVVKTSSLPIK